MARANAKPDPKRYCGIVFIGGGSSWFYAATIDEAAKKAAIQCKQDWKSLFKFEKKQELNVVVVEMTDHSGWYSNGDGVRSSDTKQIIKPTKVVKVVV